MNSWTLVSFLGFADPLEGPRLRGALGDVSLDPLGRPPDGGEQLCPGCSDLGASNPGTSLPPTWPRCPMPAERPTGTHLLPAPPRQRGVQEAQQPQIGSVRLSLARPTPAKPSVCTSNHPFLTGFKTLSDVSITRFTGTVLTRRGGSARV